MNNQLYNGTKTQNSETFMLVIIDFKSNEEEKQRKQRKNIEKKCRK